MANILSHAYKGALLSSMVTIHYTEPIDTVHQMEKSNLPLYYPGRTFFDWLSRTDPRSWIQERRVEIPFSGGIAGDEILQRYKHFLPIQIFKSFDAYFSVDRGEAMFYATNAQRASYKNRLHFSKEALAVIYLSHIVTQGSPLLVRNYGEIRNLHDCISLTYL